MGKYKMTLDLQLLNHLGLNLYSNASAVISEAVANSWDADATEVNIVITDDCIIISDDGCGMDLEDINNKYLHVGRQRRNADEAITPNYGRAVMGRKGIGKLSLFSIANSISIYSIKGLEKNALKISTVALKECIEKNEEYSPEELCTDDFDFAHDGTKIVLGELKKKRTATLATYLRRRLARRFSIIGDQYSFGVKVNNAPITISDRNYLPKAQMLWIYPSKSDPMFTEDTIVRQCSTGLAEKFLRETIVDCGEKRTNIYGWIATASEPSKLSEEDGTINKITLMVRGKMAKEDILPELRSTALYTKYIFGEIHADFLDQDDMEDITTSSRQDFFVDDERYLALIAFLKAELSFVRTRWEDARSNAGIEEACKYSVVKEWYDKLGRDSRSSAKKLFGKINQLTVSADEKLELFKHGIIAFESFKMKDELSQLERVSADNMKGFLSVAGELDILEQRLYYQIVHERLSVIQQLQKVVDENALEKVIQHHLAKNLWLLDPSWDRSTEVPEIEKSFRTLFEGISKELSREELDARLDIKYKKASSKHVIIELKRSERIVKQEDAIKQIAKYFNATEKLLREAKDSTPFEIIFLVGKTISNLDITSNAYRAFADSIKPYHARVMYYKELLRNAEILYRDFLNAHEDAASLTKLIEEIS